MTTAALAPGAGRRRHAAIYLLGVLSAGCHAGPAHRFPTARAALDRLSEQTSCNRAVQGEARLSFRGDGRRLSGRVLYLAEAPARLRFDIFSSFGATISTLTSDGTRFSLFNLEEKSFVTGAPSTCNVQRFTQVPVPPSALVELLRGRPPVLVHEAANATIAYRTGTFGAGRYEVTLLGAHQAKETLDLGIFAEDWDRPTTEQRLRLLGVTVEQAGQVLYEVGLSGHRLRHRLPAQMTAEELALGLRPRAPSGPACDVELPVKTKIFVPETGYELTFLHEETRLNPPLLADAFRQMRPGGVSVYASDCQDGLAR